MRSLAFIFIFIISFVASAAAPVKFRRAQAVRADVEIYNEANFDARVISYIKPGKYYYISNKTYGPFYKIKISDKIVGYVADTEIDIEGVGRIQEKPFIDDPDPLAATDKDPKTKRERERAEQENDDEEESHFKERYHGVVVSLVNYHEKTMDALQVADLYAIGYRYIPFLSDFSASVSWDVNVAWRPPSYYEDKLKADTSGFTIWTGAQLINISVIDANKTLRYGLGPFLKYSNYNVKTSTKSYSLQDGNLGILLEGGFIYHLGLVSFDIGLRYYWEKEAYGGLSLGFLF